VKVLMYNRLQMMTKAHMVFGQLVSIIHEWRKDQEVFATSGTYAWSFVTQIFHSSQPSHGGNRKTCEVMTST
jgi:hypothetical protein